MWSSLARFGREGEDQAAAASERAQILASGRGSLKNLFAAIPMADLAAAVVINASVAFSLNDRL